MSKSFWAVIVVIIIVFFGIFALTGKKTPGGTSSSGKATSHIEGLGQDHITLVEYGDYQCPYCGQYYPIVKQIQQEYNSQIYFQFRNFPLTSLHPNAFAAARAAEAAALQGKFWQMHDAIFGRECFLNEIIWAYDYGARTKRRWPAKHDTILVYVKDVDAYHFNSEEVDREPYMAPGLVTAEKAALGKLPTDVWWHTIVPTNGREKTGYPTQKPEGILRRIVQASTQPGDLCLDFFAGSGTLGAVAAQLGRRYVLIDSNPEAVRIMRARLQHASL